MLWQESGKNELTSDTERNILRRITFNVFRFSNVGVFKSAKGRNMSTYIAFNFQFRNKIHVMESIIERWLPIIFEI